MKSTYRIEIEEKFSDKKPCQEFVYSRVTEECMMMETRLYEFSGSGEKTSLAEFVEDVLVDPVSQSWSFRDEGYNIFDGRESYKSVIDVALKPEVLDLEKEYVMEFLNERNLFDLESLKIFTRYYLSSDRDSTVESVVNDLVNPVIHEWSVTKRGDGN